MRIKSLLLLRSLILIYLLALIRPAVLAIELDTLLEELTPREKMGRALNSEDIDLKSTAPFPLTSPEGDFDGDGVTDRAISGIYFLPGSGQHYFLLVGTELKNPRKCKSLFYKEYSSPVFIHSPGSTGEGDPKDQNFSISFCLECNDGFDFYWNPKSSSFLLKKWPKEEKRLNSTPAPAQEVLPETTIEQALKIVGDLKDVQAYVEKLKQENKPFGTKVLPMSGKKKSDRVVVKIYEKGKEGEILYDEMIVDTAKKKVIKRRRK